MLNGKTVILGVTAGIAAYKAANLASMLVKQRADVHVIMTERARNFINPITFETLTSNKCITDTFDRNFNFNVGHVSLAKRADIFVIAPASADITAKTACGIADDMLTTTFLAAKCPKLIAPAMNTAMYENEITQDNIKRLMKYGVEFILPETGRLACGDVGAGKFPKEEKILERIVNMISREKILEGKRVLVTAGATREKIDPVRYITNHSTGKMGYALASAALRFGARVTLVSGMTNLCAPGVDELVRVISAEDMFREVKSRFDSNDIIIKAAAVADYTPVSVWDEKIKKSGNMSLELKRTEDILAYIGAHKREDMFVCGFSMETRDMIENSRKKLIDKNIDMIAANNLKEEGAGFGVDTNIITLIDKDGETPLGKMSKDEAAEEILKNIYLRIKNRTLRESNK
ncbi:MAG: bifunctional phosphopantothenoylcysteine decarboxylase/phosphopantothenate--cysteine ligase CoaBC [Oscillospiraceae bacterium]|nr:bifunctional phosphopantothenoylcysteine decarboxylase/phosphopantothenate--cysteine ligase CoaBC [Oscillospiraceae bacterium]